METNNQNTNSKSDTTSTSGANATAEKNNSTTNTGNNAASNGGSESSNPLNDIMGMAAPYLGMLQDQAGRVPEMLQTACSSVSNGYKSMSTTTKVVTASALAVGVGLLVNNMRKNKKAASNGYTSNSKKGNKNRA